MCVMMTHCNTGSLATAVYGYGTALGKVTRQAVCVS